MIGLRRTLAAGALASAFVLASIAGGSGPGRGEAELPSFLRLALGTPQSDARLVRAPADGVRVAIGRDGFTVASGAASVSLASDSRGTSSWTPFAHGVSRPTPFGSETVVVDGEKAEHYLTVSRRQGDRTWRWKLGVSGLEPRLTQEGAVSVQARTGEDLRILPAAVYDATGSDVTPENTRWSLVRNAGAWWLELRLDDARLPVPYVIDPAVDYPSPLFLSSTASSVTGSWRLTSTAGILPNAATRTSVCRNCVGYVQWQPGIDNGFPATPSSTPTGHGWVVDAAGATAFPAGNWSFTVKTQVPDALLAAGQAVLAVGVWKGTVVGGAFMPTQTLLAPSDDPAGQNLRASVITTTTATYALPQFSLAPGETLYVEYWRNQVVGINDSSLLRRYVDFVVGDGAARIVHPSADDAAPAQPVQTISESSPDSFSSGSTFYYRPTGGAGGATFTVASTTADSGSGVQKVTFPGLAGGMTPASATDDSTSPYTQTYSWSTGATESGARTVTAVDNAGNAASSTFSIVADATAPAGGSVVYPDGDDEDGVVTILTANGSDGGSGINASSGILERQTAPLSNGVCGSFGSWTAVTSPDTVPSDMCAHYRYRVFDNVGNEVVYTSESTVRVPNADLTPPDAPLLTLTETEADEHVSGATLYYNPTGANTGTFTVDAVTVDPQSGVARVDFPDVFGGDGSADSSPPFRTTYSWTSSAAASGLKTITAVNGAGLAAHSTFTLIPDTSAPALSVATPADGAAIREGQALTATAVDTLAGTEEVEFRYCTGPTCTWASATSLGTDTASPFTVPWSSQPSDGQYTLVSRARDRVGNVAEQSVAVTIDNAAPLATQNNPGTPLEGVVTLEATASDAAAGLAAVEFQVSPGGEGSWTSLGTDTATPYSVLWDTLTVDDGRYDLRVVATDRAGNVAVSPAVRNRQVTNHPPIVSITSPDSTFVTGADQDPFTIEAVSPSSNLRHVEFFSCSNASVSCSSGSWVALGLDDTAPYAATWPLDPDGNRALKAVVTNISFAQGTDVNNVTIDRTGPAGGWIAYAGGYDADGLVPLSTTYGTDDGSGVDESSGITERQTAPLAHGSCGAFGDWTGAPANPDPVAHGLCARYRYTVFDEAGNRTTYTSAEQVLVDLTPPAALAFALAEDEPDQHANGSTLYYNPSGVNSGAFAVSASASDPESGVAAVEFPVVFGADGGSDSAEPFAAVYAWTSASSATGGQTVRARNGAGLEAQASFTVAPDTAAPTISITEPGAGAILRNGQPVAADATDGLTGPQVLEVRYCAGSACDWSTATPIGSTPGGSLELDWTGQPADGDYTLLARALDQVGNESAIEARTVTVDNTAPAVSLLEPSGYVNAAAPDPVRVTATSVDAIASLELFRCDDASTDCASGSWESLGSSASAPFSATTPVADGARAFRAIARDAAGNSATAVLNVVVDRTAPSGPEVTSSHTPGNASSDDTIDISLASAADDVSGLAGFSFHWDSQPASAPDGEMDADETTAVLTSPELDDGTWYFHVRAADRAGNWGGPVHAGPFLVDTSPLSAASVPAITPLASIQLAKTFSVSWNATGAVGYDIRYRVAGPSGAFGADATWLTGTTAAGAVFSGLTGSTYCFTARALDDRGVPSAWGAETCTALPLDNTALAHSAGWSKKRAPGHYLGTYSISSRKGASLTRARVGATRIAVVATRCRGCGVLGVYWGRTLVRKVSLASTTTAKKQVVQLPLFPSFAQGTVKLTVLSSGKPVMVDGLAVSPR